jgi:hypothetical protein
MRFASAFSVAVFAATLLPTSARADDAWRARLEDPSPETRRQAASELAAIGRKAIPILREVYAEGRITESSPLWCELDWIGKEIAKKDATSAALAAGVPVKPISENPAAPEPRVVTEAGGFKTLAGYLARKEGSLGHWTFTVVDLGTSGIDVVERGVVVDDLSDESFTPVFVRTIGDVADLFKHAPAIPRSVPGAAHVDLVFERARTALAVLRLTRSRAHTHGALFPEQGTKENWRSRLLVESSKTGEDTFPGITMQLGHDWYDLVVVFGDDGRLERLDAKTTGSCD